MAKLSIPTALRAYTERQAKVDADGATVGAALAALADRYPDLRPHLFDEAGELRGFVNVFVGDTNIRSLAGLATPVTPDSVVALVPAIAGGLR
ncbi:MAG: MoaD/ThiS family protein [Propionibacteriaceae bacterium]|jgi:molybdopterin converting factor small subunit|nr:MoaD/ThiS family protein [Propionibacteriaceae bacterium]